MGQFLELFQKVNGLEILKRYGQAHVLLFALTETAILGLEKKSLEIVRLAVEYKILKKLRKQYANRIKNYKKKKTYDKRAKKASEYVWICWFQGMENAPEIVKKCYESIKKNIHEKQIILITKENYGTYVKFPPYIMEKYEKGLIGQAHFADLLRLELLIKYGGTWIDSTVFCSSDQIPEYLLNSELFVYRKLKPGLDGHAITISNWFITSQKNNPILELTLYLLYDYWKKNNYVIDYYIFHLFFELSCEAFPEEWRKVVPATNSTPHNLLLHFFEDYNKDIYDGIIQQSCFHKLTYKLDKNQINRHGTNYEFFIQNTE